MAREEQPRVLGSLPRPAEDFLGVFGGHNTYFSRSLSEFSIVSPEFFRKSRKSGGQEIGIVSPELPRVILKPEGNRYCVPGITPGITSPELRCPRNYAARPVPPPRIPRTPRTLHTGIRGAVLLLGFVRHPQRDQVKELSRIVPRGDEDACVRDVLHAQNGSLAQMGFPVAALAIADELV